MVATTLRLDRPAGGVFVPYARPRLSWTTVTSIAGWRQAVAELELDGRDIVRIEGDESVAVAWPFAPLEPRTSATVRVRVRGVDGSAGEWSDAVEIVAGFLAPGEWVADSIALPSPDAGATPGLARQEFEVGPSVARATLYATALGAYQVSINGEDVDDHVLKPGWTSYDLRTVHDTTDVTGLLVAGANAIGVRFAGAWATEAYGPPSRQRRVYRDQPCVAAQLVIEYADGRTDIVATDRSWRVGQGAIVTSGIYQGETADARLDARGFDTPGFDDAAWAPASIVEPLCPEARLSPPVRRTQFMPVVETLVADGERVLLDFGQNLVGRLRLRLRGERGRTITVRHAEVLEGEQLARRPLRNAAATDTYVLAGEGVEEWEPEFTFHGFRYAEITNWPGRFDPRDVTAVVVQTDMERTGWFECSEPLVERLHENVVWSLRGNFLSVPTDCPQRDERLGWTGDIQIFAPTAAFLYDVRGFLASWLRDLSLEQAAAAGVVPFVVPSVLEASVPAAGWGDAATVVPWVLYQHYGDPQILSDQYASAAGWVDLVAERAGEAGIWSGDFQFGDWLDPTAPPEDAGDGATHPDVVATAYLYRSARLVASMATRLGHVDDVGRFTRLAERVRAAFVEEYITPAGRMMSDSQAAYAIALEFGLAPEHLRAPMSARLQELVREGGYRIGTGFVGTPLIQDALTHGGKDRTASRLLFQTEPPSWLYPVTQGATTMWERWDSLRPDGTLNPGGMTSFNHYALGSVADWLHRVVGGLSVAEPGGRLLAIAPRPLPGLTHAAAEHVSAYGRARAGWTRDGEDIVVTASVPPNAEAEVTLPDGSRFRVGSGDHEWRSADLLPRWSPRRLSMSSSLAEIVDDPAAYRALFDALSEVDADFAVALCAGTRWLPGRTIGELLGDGRRAQARTGFQRRLAALNAREGVVQ